MKIAIFGLGAIVIAGVVVLAIFWFVGCNSHTNDQWVVVSPEEVDEGTIIDIVGTPVAFKPPEVTYTPKHATNFSCR